MNSAESPPKIDVITPQSGWKFLDFNEIWEYKDLVYFLTWRDIKARYAQSTLGFSWAVVQPVFLMIVFSIIFGRLVKIDSDGVPYPIFSYTALVPWSLYSSSLSGATGSFVANTNVMSKVYVPKIVFPLTSIFSRLPDFFIALILVFGLMVWYGQAPSIWLLFLPMLVLLIIVQALGVGLWFGTLAVQFRDVRYGVGLLVQVMMYATPIVYPASLIPEKYRLIYGINPMAGVIEAFRSAMLSTRPMPWDLLAVGVLTSVVVLVSGVLFFRRMERNFVDVV